MAHSTQAFIMPAIRGIQHGISIREVGSGWFKLCSFQQRRCGLNTSYPPKKLHSRKDDDGSSLSYKLYEIFLLYLSLLSALRL